MAGGIPERRTLGHNDGPCPVRSQGHGQRIRQGREQGMVGMDSLRCGHLEILNILPLNLCSLSEALEKNRAPVIGETCKFVAASLILINGLLPAMSINKDITVISDSSPSGQIGRRTIPAIWQLSDCSYSLW